MRGRKPEQESRAAEFRQRLMAWKLAPVSSRLSLRALARELGTSHQLLKYYLDGMEKWRCTERCRQATEEADQIIARAIVEGRPMTEWEQYRRYECTMTAIRARIGSLVLSDLARIKKEARRGPLPPIQFKMLKIFAKNGFQGAQEFFDKLRQNGTRSCKNNLPAISDDSANSFRTV